MLKAMWGVSVVILFSVGSIHFDSVAGFTFNFNNNNNGNQQNPGFFWNAFRAYAQPDEQKESDEDPEYMYELLFGHQIRDIDKYKRQQGCLCNNRFKDPHCASDNKLYDNGCYFECAQKRNPELRLLKWGKC